uniref:Uncharacterized protein n=1 Tax=Panagrolaimus davidi TaxID=227884 RepID=A0A914Q2H3_9BILA
MFLKRKCVGAVVVPANNEGRLYIVEYDFEGNSDKLTLNYGNSQKQDITWLQRSNLIKVPIYYKLTSDISANAQLEFKSDGNMQGAGYTAYLETYENGKNSEKITSTSKNIERYYSSKSNVTIQFHSGPSGDAVTTEDKMWGIVVSTMVAPVFVKVTLNETNTKYVQW